MAVLFPGVDFGAGVAEVVANENCCVLKVENETGEGLMTYYRPFPGVVVMYNDFHLRYCVTSFETRGDELLCIDHCREGAMERQLRPEVYYYVSAGDVTVDDRRRHAGRTDFPQSHFHGVSVAFYLPQAQEQLPKELAGFPVSLRALQQRFCTDGAPHVLQKPEALERIFAQMYRLPTQNRRELLRLKVFELLLYLENVPPQSAAEKPYFYKSQVEKTRAAQRLMTERLAEHCTVAQLAQQLDISQSALKSCFKAIYGQPVHTYLQQYRIRQAAELLQSQRALPVAQVASRVGYDSPGKFSAVFKRVYGVTPKEYRNGGR